MRRSLLTLSCTLLCAGLLSGCPGDELPDELDNREPVARLVWPQRWVQGAGAPFDASGSEDLDGLLVRWSASFGDGTPEQDSDTGLFEHLYAAAGSFDRSPFFPTAFGGAVDAAVPLRPSTGGEPAGAPSAGVAVGPLSPRRSGAPWTMPRR